MSAYAMLEKQFLERKLLLNRQGCRVSCSLFYL